MLFRVVKIYLKTKPLQRNVKQNAKELPVDMRIAKYMLLLSLSLFLTCGSSGNAAEGPLLFQVHFASPAANIGAADIISLLAGDAKPANKALGSVRLYADKRIAGALAAENPNLRFTECAAAPAEDRQALYISDVRGLVPAMKLLTVSGHYPWGRLEKDYSVRNGSYPVMRKYAQGWNESRHVTIVQTGVTAMSRAFIRAVEAHGDLKRPVADIKPITAAADISATSNEVSFTDNCSYPLPDRMVFCSPKKYFAILREAGFNVIELTGNHNNDYGAEANRQTIDLYEKNGISFFGGGRNKAEAERTLYLNVKGMSFAFVGFNQWGPKQAWASENRAGAARLTVSGFDRAVREAVSKADTVFVSVQWGNEDNPIPHKEQIDFFHRAADLGACIMVSSSAHRAMGIEFYKGRFISYGLGNVLFDQMQTINHRRGMIARHHFYGSRHVQTELIPYLMYNSSEPKIAGGREAAELFEYVFKYSRGAVFYK